MCLLGCVCQQEHMSELGRVYNQQHGHMSSGLGRVYKQQEHTCRQKWDVFS